MILRAIKIVILVAFLTRLSVCRFREVTASKTDHKENFNETMEFPNLMLQQKEKEGVSAGWFHVNL